MLALAGSFTLLFGDSCLNTQIYACLGDYYREYSTEACAIYKFLKVILPILFQWINCEFGSGIGGYEYNFTCFLQGV